MPDIDPKLGLTLPLPTDPFELSDIRGNWEKLARYPGILSVHNSSLLPDDWNTNHRGMVVHDAQADVFYLWTGSAFQRIIAKGWLASHAATSNVSCTTSFTTVAQTTAPVPPGGRRIEVTGSWSEVTAKSSVAIYRGSTQLTEQTCPKDSGGTITFIDVPGSSSPTYALRARASSGTTTVKGSVSAPITLSVKEI